jgi:hypothetical protein
MFKRIAIAGLGPHADFAADLDPEGTTLLSGPSEAGKSFVLEALVFVLWGRSARGKFAPEAIRDGGTKASVELTLASGRILRRSVTRSRAMTRSVVAGGQKTSYDNEPGFVAAIPDRSDELGVAHRWERARLSGHPGSHLARGGRRRRGRDADGARGTRGAAR